MVDKKKATIDIEPTYNEDGSPRDDIRIVVLAIDEDTGAKCIDILFEINKLAPLKDLQAALDELDQGLYEYAESLSEMLDIFHKHGRTSDYRWEKENAIKHDLVYKVHMPFLFYRHDNGVEIRQYNYGNDDTFIYVIVCGHNTYTCIHSLGGLEPEETIIRNACGGPRWHNQIILSDREDIRTALKAFHAWPEKEQQFKNRNNLK